MTKERRVFLLPVGDSHDYSIFFIDRSPTCLIFHAPPVFVYSTRASAAYFALAFAACNWSARVYTRFCASSVLFLIASSLIWSADWNFQHFSRPPMHWPTKSD